MNRDLARLAPVADVAVGIDIGGTKTHAVAVAGHGEVVASRTLPTVRGADSVVATTSELFESLQRSLGGRRIVSVGAGVPGTVEASSGRVRNAVNVGLTDVALADALTERLGTPVRVENDVNLAALGATVWTGSTDSLAFLNLGTGVAVGAVVDGAVYRGSSGVAGEIGHLPVRPDGPACVCGQRGCLELYVSGSGLSRLWPGAGPGAVRDLFSQADAGVVQARAVVDRFFTDLAWTVQLIVLSLDVQLVVIGGGVTGLRERLRRPLVELLAHPPTVSPFVASLGLADRVCVMPVDFPAAAIGAALFGLAQDAEHTAHA